MRWTYDLHIDVRKFTGGWWVHLDYNVSSGPFLSFEIEIEIGDGPGPELDNYASYIVYCTCKLIVLSRLAFSLYSRNFRR